MEWIIIIVILIVIGISYDYFKENSRDKRGANEKLSSLQNEVSRVIALKDAIESKLDNIDTESKKLNVEYQRTTANLKKQKEDLDNLASQRSKGFPLLGEVYQEYFDIKTKLETNYLKNKKRPATKAAEFIQESNKEKKALKTELKILEYKIKNYELIAPFLVEAVEETRPEDDEWILNDYTEEELQDETVRFLTKEEYRKLSVSDRNQLALDRYWARRKKSSWLVGKMYEHYVGYLYELDGWEVEYFGIKKRYDDEGKDLIAKKGDECHIVQCKNWAEFRTIYENHIFQLFGTTFEYQDKNPKLKVAPVFYTSTKLSERATEFAKRLNITVKERIRLEKYPSIKCNISRATKDKIYHLPFDQQYDNAIIEPKMGEFYCETVLEAEKAGFRRALKWQGDRIKN